MSWCSSTTTPGPSPRLARGDVEALRRPRRHRGRRAGRTAVGDGAPAWFPPEFGWVVGCSYTGQPERTGDGAQPDRRQHVVPPRVRRGGGRLPRRGGSRRRRRRSAARRPSCRSGSRSATRARASCTSRPPSCTTTCPADRGRWAYFRRRCWAEGLSKAQVSRLSDPTPGAGQRTRLRPPGAPARRGPRRPRLGRRPATRAALVRAGAIVAGLALTVGGYATGHRTHPPRPAPRRKPENTMQGTQMPASGWLNFDIHGKVGIQGRGPGARARRSCGRCSPASPRTARCPADIVVSERAGADARRRAAGARARLHRDRACASSGERVQVVLDGGPVPRPRRRRAADLRSSRCSTGRWSTAARP